MSPWTMTRLFINNGPTSSPSESRGADWRVPANLAYDPSPPAPTTYYQPLSPIKARLSWADFRLIFTDGGGGALQPPVCETEKLQWFPFSSVNFPDILRWEKGAQTQTFLSGYLLVGWGASAWMGGGQKVRYVSWNPWKTNFLGGISRDFAAISRWRPKSVRKKFVFNFWPIERRLGRPLGRHLTLKQQSLVWIMALFSPKSTLQSQTAPGEHRAHDWEEQNGGALQAAACSDRIAWLFVACFSGVSHNYRAICCKMGYCTAVPVWD